MAVFLISFISCDPVTQMDSTTMLDFVVEFKRGNNLPKKWNKMSKVLWQGRKPHIWYQNVYFIIKDVDNFTFCVMWSIYKMDKSILRISLNVQAYFLLQPCCLSLFFLNKCRVFLSLMETAGLTDLLKQEGSYTIFAPTDEAFESLTTEDFELLKSECCPENWNKMDLLSGIWSSTSVKPVWPDSSLDHGRKGLEIINKTSAGSPRE